jgi:hypothetical protein
MNTARTIDWLFPENIPLNTMKTTSKVRTLAATIITIGSLAGGASAATISTSDYSLTSMTGSLAWGDYDYNRANDLSAGFVNTVSDLAIVNTMLSDGLPTEPFGNGPGGSTGIYNWSSALGAETDATIALSVNTGLNALVSGVRVWVSRSYSSSTPVEVFTRISGGTWTSRFSSTSGAMGFASNNSSATPHDLLFPAVAADEVRFDFGGAGGNQIGVNEFLILGDVEVVPEPSSTALLGLGGLALMLRRRR